MHTNNSAYLFSYEQTILTKVGDSIGDTLEPQTVVLAPTALSFTNPVLSCISTEKVVEFKIYNSVMTSVGVFSIYSTNSSKTLNLTDVGITQSGTYYATSRAINPSGIISPTSDTLSFEIPAVPVGQVTALLHFDGTQGSTTVVDSTGATGWTMTGASLNTSLKKFGASSCFISTYDSAVKSSNNSGNYTLGTSDFTVEGFFAPYESRYAPAWGRFFQFGNNSTQGGLWIIRTGTTKPRQLTVQLHDTSNYFNLFPTSTSLTLPDYVFTHVALTREGSIWRLFIGGALAGMVNYSGAGSNLTADKFLIGSNETNAECFNGWIDEVRLTKGFARYTAPFSPPTSPFTYP